MPNTNLYHFSQWRLVKQLPLVQRHNHAHFIVAEVLVIARASVYSYLPNVTYCTVEVQPGTYNRIPFKIFQENETTEEKSFFEYSVLSIVYNLPYHVYRTEFR